MTIHISDTRIVGEYIHKPTGEILTICRGRRRVGDVDVYFRRYRGNRVIITDASFTADYVTVRTSE